MSSLNNKRAVALKYDKEKKAAPTIVASGNGYMASKVIKIAEENGVPVYKDNSLATMLSQLEVGSEIPEELYKTIVDIYVYFLDYNKKNNTDNGKGSDLDNNKKEEIDCIVSNNDNEKTSNNSNVVNPYNINERSFDNE